MQIKVKQTSGRLNGSLPLDVMIDDERVDEIGPSEEKTIPLTGPEGEFKAGNILAKSNKIPVKDGDVVYLRRSRIHYTIVALLIAFLSLMVAVDFSTTEFFIYLLAGGAIFYIIDNVIFKSHIAEVVDHIKKEDTGSDKIV